jgi:hypothetical protein
MRKRKDDTRTALAWTNIYVNHFAVVNTQKISSTVAAKKSEVIATFWRVFLLLCVTWFIPARA